jgi:hypothetical protein
MHDIGQFQIYYGWRHHPPNLREVMNLVNMELLEIEVLDHSHVIILVDSWGCYLKLAIL